jgi:hypothetical protein
LRELATSLAYEDWHTELYAAFEEALRSDELDGLITQTRGRIEEAWESYCQTPVTDEEVTAQTVVGHRILREGFETWHEALDEAEAADGSVDQALALAQAGNRLLIAVQVQAQRVEQMASSPQKLRMRSRRLT